MTTIDNDPPVSLKDLKALQTELQGETIETELRASVQTCPSRTMTCWKERGYRVGCAYISEKRTRWLAAALNEFGRGQSRC